MPEYVWVKNARGVEYAVVEAAFDPEIHEEVEGARAVLDANGLPTLATESPEDMPAEWAQYDTSQGMDPSEDEAADVADLIADHGKEN